MEIKSIATLILALLLAPPLLRAQDFATPSPPPSTSTGSSASSSPSSSPSLPPPVITARGSNVIQAPALIALLPAAPPGWLADKPEGSTSTSTGFPLTTVGNVYVKGGAEDAPTTTINIIDSANNQQFQDATKAMWNATSNTPEGYDKPVSVAGLPGFEHFANTGQTGVLWVICGGRFFVQVETTHQSASDLEAWLPRIDLKKLATLR